MANRQKNFFGASGDVPSSNKVLGFSKSPIAPILLTEDGGKNSFRTLSAALYKFHFVPYALN